MQRQTQWMQFNAECWVENYPSTGQTNYDPKKDAFLPAVIQGTNKDKVRVKFIGAGLDNDDIPMIYVSKREGGQALMNETVDNLVNLPLLNEAEMLRQLKSRFRQKKIYCAVGDTLLIMNPYEQINELFNPQIMAKYAQSHTILESENLPPHIYGLTAAAFRDLFDAQRNQSLVISGESGSGKTECTKHALSLITMLSNNYSSKSIHAPITRKHSSEQLTSVEELLMGCNPLLECFGNSKTIRNDNSSRFGKLITLIMNSNRVIEAAQFQIYLLEKSRVTFQTSDERNYHIFYSLLKGLNDKELDMLGLKQFNSRLDYSKFKILSSNPRPIINGWDDLDMFNKIQFAFGLLKFKQNEIHTVYTILSAILLMGNLDYDESTLTNEQPCTITPPRLAKRISELLGIDPVQFERALLFKTRSLSFGQIIDSPLARLDCIAQRDSIMRDLYDQLFNWLVQRINDITVQQMTSSTQKHNRKIEILDIFGFEVLQINSFEQLCINYANERLQQLFIKQTFVKDKQELDAEGLGGKQNEFQFIDNQAVIDLLDTRSMAIDNKGQKGLGTDKSAMSGIFVLIDDSLSMNQTDDHLLIRFKSAYNQPPQNQIFLPVKASENSKTTFIIKHTPRAVQYDITGFRAKNKDEVGKSFLNVISKSTNPVVVNIMEHHEEGQKTAKTLGAKFRQQINDLINELQTCKINFVRCIKPNEQKAKGQFAEIYVLQQIRYLGVADSIRIRVEGFPYRMTFQEFYKRYGEMELNKYSYPQLVAQNANFKYEVAAMKIWQTIGNDPKHAGYLFGETKIFIRQHVRDQIEEMYIPAMKRKRDAALRIQKSWQRYKYVKRYLAIKRSIRRIQMQFRVKRMYRFFKKQRASAIKIQRWYRRKINEKTRAQFRGNAITVQKYFKRTSCLKAYIHTKINLIFIQRFCRSKINVIRRRRRLQIIKLFDTYVFERVWLRIQRRAAIKIQRRVRGWLTRKKYGERVRHLLHFRNTYYKRKALLKLQALARGFIVRIRCRRLHRAARYIQGFMRSYWTSLLFMRVKLATTFIQRCYRRYKSGRGKIDKMMKQYLEHNEQAFNKYQQKHRREFIELQRQFCHTGFSLAGTVKTWVYPLLLSVETVHDLRDAYEGGFQRNLFDFIKQRSNEGVCVMELRCGDAHMLASCSNQVIYTWGMNDYFQLGKMVRGGYHFNKDFILDPPVKNSVQSITSGTRIKTVATGGNHNFILNYNQELFVFGKGEIGLFSQRNICVPSQLTFNGLKNVFQGVQARASQSVLIINNQAYMSQGAGQVLRCMNFRTPIVSSSAGLNFVAFLSSNGIVYLSGDAPAPEPFNSQIELNPRYFHGEKILQVECGQKHLIVRTSLGKVFTWGWGFKGQLGLGNFKTTKVPQIVQMPKWTKAIQVQACMTSSIVLCEGKKLYWWGTNCVLQYQCHPVAIPLDTLLNMNENFPLRLEASWSRSAGIIYVKMADMSGVNLPLSTKLKMAQTLAVKWSEGGHQQDVPFIESYAQFFGGNDIMQTPHYSKDPTFRQAPILEIMHKPKVNDLPQLNHEEHIKEIMFLDRFKGWEEPSRLRPKFVDDEDSLLPSGMVSPQKELERIKSSSTLPHSNHPPSRESGARAPRNNENTPSNLLQTTTITTATTNVTNNIHTHIYSPHQHPPHQTPQHQPITHLHQPPLHQPQQQQHLAVRQNSTGSFQDRQSQKRIVTNPSQDKLQNHKTPSINNQPPPAPHQSKHLPSFSTPGESFAKPPTVPQSNPNKNVSPRPRRDVTPPKSTTPTKLKFKQNGEHQSSLEYTREELIMMERLQQNLKAMKLRMENLLRIPRDKWTATDDAFMHSMQDHNIRNQLKLLK